MEFKESLPKHADLAKTAIAFANDAGGELYIGVKGSPRTVIGLPENELMKIEEQIANIIFDKCYPAILPDISFLTVDDKHLIKVTIYPGSVPPYYLKEKGKMHGTCIRVGSSNRLADEMIIAGLERRRRNISFDAEIITEKSAVELNIDSFKNVFREKTGDPLDMNALRKMDLIKSMQGVDYPTNALVLFSDDDLRGSLFHFAKVECARFKGIKSEEFIDRKSIGSNIAFQAEEAYQFVLRHINQGAMAWAQKWRETPIKTPIKTPKKRPKKRQKMKV